MKGYYAFWSCSGVPPWLGGCITKMFPNGKVETEEYGPGFHFYPVKILPPEVGAKLLADLKAMAAEFQEAEDKLHSDFMQRAEDLMWSTR